jgi:hypothetical protein
MTTTLCHFPDFRNWVTLWFQDIWSESLDDLTTDHLENAVETISLARKYNIPKVLKRAFYELLTTAGFGQAGADDGEKSEAGSADGDDEQDEGSDEGDGSDRERDEEGDRSDEENGANDDATSGNDKCLLSRDDIRRLITALEHLTTAWVLTAAAVPINFKCPAIFAQFALMALPHAIADNLYDPVNGFSALMNTDWAGMSLSGNCIKVRLDAIYCSGHARYRAHPATHVL